MFTPIQRMGEIHSHHQLKPCLNPLFLWLFLEGTSLKGVFGGAKWNLSVHPCYRGFSKWQTPFWRFVKDSQKEATCLEKSIPNFEKHQRTTGFSPCLHSPGWATHLECLFLTVTHTFICPSTHTVSTSTRHRVSFPIRSQDAAPDGLGIAYVLLGTARTRDGAPAQSQEPEYPKSRSKEGSFWGGGGVHLSRARRAPSDELMFRRFLGGSGEIERTCLGVSFFRGRPKMVGFRIWLSFPSTKTGYHQKSTHPYLFQRHDCQKGTVRAEPSRSGSKCFLLGKSNRDLKGWKMM